MARNRRHRVRRAEIDANAGRRRRARRRRDRRRDTLPRFPCSGVRKPGNRERERTVPCDLGHECDRNVERVRLGAVKRCGSHVDSHGILLELGRKATLRAECHRPVLVGMRAAGLPAHPRGEPEHVPESCERPLCASQQRERSRCPGTLTCRYRTQCLSAAIYDRR